jgi:glyoxylate reductase
MTSDTPTVYLTRDMPDAGLELLEAECEVVVWPEDGPPPKAHVVDELARLDAEALFCNVSDVVDAAVLDASPDLAVVSTLSVGYDHIDVAAAEEREIELGHTPGVLMETCADFAWALMTAAARRVVEAQGTVTDGEWGAWGPTVLAGPDVHGGTLGVVGLGEIGTAVARRAAGFDMDVLYAHTGRQPETEAELAEYGVDAEYVPHEELYAESDFVTLHAPLRASTQRMVGREEFRLMSEDAVFVNTGRGELVDTDALDEALESGWIGSAALDVTDPEPLPAEHPLLRHEPEKLIVTPHVGSASIPTRTRMTEMAAENVLAACRGESVPHSIYDDV